MLHIGKKIKGDIHLNYFFLEDKTQRGEIPMESRHQRLENKIGTWYRMRVADRARPPRDIGTWYRTAAKS